MNISKIGIDLIKEFEELVLTAAPDPVGILTVGYGHVVKGDEPFDCSGTITEDQAEILLGRDLQRFVNNANTQISAPTLQNQFDAMVSLSFNIGDHGFNGSTVLRDHNKGLLNDAANAFLMWNKAGGKVLRGLMIRRIREGLYYKHNKIITDAEARSLEPMYSATYSLI